jgi:hypothetical protein
MKEKEENEQTILKRRVMVLWGLAVLAGRSGQRDVVVRVTLSNFNYDMLFFD